MTYPSEIQHHGFGILRLDHEEFGNYLGEVLLPERRIGVELELDTRKISLNQAIEAAWESFERFLRRADENRMRTAELLLPDIHHFFSESYTAQQVSEKLILAGIYLDESGYGSARYDSGGVFKKGWIEADFEQDGLVSRLNDPN